MQLTDFDWSVILAVFGVIGILAGLTFTIIGFFLKRTMSNVDSHDISIQTIKEDFATKDDLEKVRTELMVGDKTAAHDKDINDIKRTYVTKDELKELKSELRNEVRDLKAELREENKQLTADVAEIKNHYIRKDDFYRTISDLNREIGNIRDLLIKMNGGNDNGQK